MPAWNPTVFSRHIPNTCRTELAALRESGHRILCVAFPPAGGDRWSIVTDKSLVNRGIPQACDDRMHAMRTDGHRVLCVAFPLEGGNRWCVVTDRDVAMQGIPTGCRDRIRALRADGHQIRWVAFAGLGNRWSIITDRDFVNQGVPTECTTRMAAFRSAGNRVVSVAFPMIPGVPVGGNRFSIATESGAFFNRDTPPGCHRVMRAMSQLGVGRVSSVGFHPDGSYVVLTDGAPEGADHAVLQDGTERFSLTRFASNLREQLDGKTVKYGFVVRYGQAVRAWSAGPGRVAGDLPTREFSVFDWFNPASVTKTITSVALLHALHARSLGTNTRIWRWLPRDWTIPTSVRTITVSELLNHRSGFRGGEVTYAGLRSMVQAGVSLENKVSAYSNSNYGLARILVAMLSGASPREGHGAVLAAATALGFRLYCQQHIFDRIGVPSVAWKADAKQPTLFYSNPPVPFTGTTYGDWTSRPGSAGVHLSLAELTSFATALTGGDALLPAAVRTVLEDEGLGWFRGGDGRSERHEHGGFFPGSRNGGAQLHSVLFAYRNGVHGAVLINGDNEKIGFSLPAAYDAAWQVPTRRGVGRIPRAKLAPLTERVREMQRLPGWLAE